MYRRIRQIRALQILKLHIAPLRFVSSVIVLGGALIAIEH